MKARILILISVGILFSCSGDDEQSQTIDMRINHYQNTGIAEGLFLTLMVQQDDAIGSDSWNKFYSTIEGFDYQPGTVYDITVTVEEISNPPADGSSLKYTLKEIRSTMEVEEGTLFDIDLKINGQSFITSSEADYELLGQIRIDCDSLCEELNARMESQDAVVGTFIRLESNEIQLVELQ